MASACLINSWLIRSRRSSVAQAATSSSGRSCCHSSTTPSTKSRSPIYLNGKILDVVEFLRRATGSHDPGEVQITRVDASDADAIAVARGLFEEYRRTLGVDVCFQQFDLELASLPGDYAPPRGCLLLAYGRALPIGCVALRDLGDGVAEMK